jgi:predicted DNA binding CopG/RHH family protein
MKKTAFPKTDSIQELARFWDSHDLTDFQAELEEVAMPVFVRGRSINLRLSGREIEAMRGIAESEGVSQSELIRRWILPHLKRRRVARAAGQRVA